MNSQTGAVALIVTVLVAVLISIVTISLSDVLTTEQRQSTDIHDSERAYYAANAGIEDALARIRHYSDFNCLYQEDDTGHASLTQLFPDKPCLYTGNPPSDITNNISCTNQDPNDPEDYRRFEENGRNSACWTYRTISRTIDQFSGDLVADTDIGAIQKGGAYSVQADLSSAFDPKSVGYIEVQWGSTNPAVKCNLNSDGTTGALLEATVVSFNESGSPDLQLNRGILLPRVTQNASTGGQFGTGTGGPGCGQAQVDGARGSLDGSGPNPVLYGEIGGSNDANSGTDCRYNFSDLDSNGNPIYPFCARLKVTPGRLYVVRLRNKFNANTYKVTAWESNQNNQEHVNSNLADISVTGRAGDTYRRLIVRKQVYGDVFSIFDFVLLSEDDLTKNLTCIDSSNPNSCN